MNRGQLKLLDIILLSLTVALLIIGIHQIQVMGFAKGYWALMLALIAFLGYQLRKGNRESNPQSEEHHLKSSKKFGRNK